MNKEQFQNIITLYKSAEKSITELDQNYGIRIWDSDTPNFYNNYNKIIHDLFVEIFGAEQTNLIEDYIFQSTNITFESLCLRLNIT